MTRLFCLIASVLLLPLSAFAAETGFICIADAATGFTYEKSTNTWRDSSFKADGKYVLTKSQQSGIRWHVKQVGSDFPIAFCDSDFTETGAISCRGILHDFRMNKNNRRFLLVYPVGYWTDKNPKVEKTFQEGRTNLSWK